MPEMLQALIDKLQGEAVEEAERQASAILAAAQARADAIVAAATAEAETTRRAAEARADGLAERGRLALEQAARDVLLALRGRVVATATELARGDLRATLDVATLRRMVLTLVEAYAAGGRPADVLLSEADRADLGRHLAERYGGRLAEGVELLVDDEVEAGFRFRLEGDELVHDVTLGALVEALARMVQPELRAALERAAAATGVAGATGGAERDAVRS